MKFLKWILAAAACALAIHVANAQTPPKPGATPQPAAVNDTPTKAFEELFNESSFHMWPGGQIAAPDNNPIIWNPWGKTDGTTWWTPSLCTNNNYLLSGGTGATILSLVTSNCDCNANNQGWRAAGIGTAAFNSGGALNGLSTGFLAKPPCYWEFGVWIPSLGTGDAVGTTGLWPSISLYTDPGNAATENIEYDLFEMYSGENTSPARTYPTVHTTWHNFKSGASNGAGTTESSDISGAWHTWGIWIDTATTHWYLDGTELFNAPTQGTTQVYPVIANAIGGGWPININKANQYTMKLSYVDCWTGSGGTVNTPGTFVQSAVTTQPASGTSTSVTLSGEKSGDLNVVYIFEYQGNTGVTPSSVTDTAGNVYTLACGPVSGQGHGPMSVYYSNGISAGNDTITVTWSGAVTFTEIVASEYFNNGQVSVESQTTASSTSSGTSLSVGPISASSGDLVVTSYHNNNVSSSSQVTYPSGYTKIATGSDYQEVASLLTTSSGNQSVTWSSTQTAQQQLGALAAFKFGTPPALACTVVQSSTSQPYPANTTSLSSYLNNPLSKGDNIMITAKDGSGNPLAITSAGDNAGIGDTYASTGGNNSTWQTTNAGGIAGTNWGGAQFTAGFASTNNPSITVTECGTPPPPPAAPPLPVLPANTLPAAYNVATTGPKFNEDFTSLAYQPGQGPCNAIAAPTTPISGTYKWSTHKSPPYPCQSMIPFGTDANGNFGIWTHAPITGFTSDGGGIHSGDSSGSGEGFTDAYYEALVKLPPNVTGMHPVLWGRWLIADNGVLINVNNPEIDWMEYGVAETSSATGTYKTSLGIWNGTSVTWNLGVFNTIPAGNGYNGMGSGWHVFGVWVQPANTPGGANVKYYLDGTQVQSVAADASLHSNPISMRISMGQDTPGFDGTPRELAVRYMRVWSQ